MIPLLNGIWTGYWYHQCISNLLYRAMLPSIVKHCSVDSPSILISYSFSIKMGLLKSHQEESENSQVVKTTLNAVRLEVGGTEELLHVAERVAEIRCSPWTKSMFRLYGCLLISYFCGCLNGFDGSLMGGLNAMDSYQNAFHTQVHIYLNNSRQCLTQMTEEPQDRKSGSSWQSTTLALWPRSLLRALLTTISADALVCLLALS